MDDIFEIWRFNEFYLRKMVEPLADADLLLQPFPGMNSPAWILGHLAICPDFGAALLGLEKTSPAKWMALFGPGSKPEKLTELPLGKLELLDNITAGYERLMEMCRSASPDVLNQPHGVAFLNVLPFKTKRGILMHLLSSHASAHLGQLATWRRCRGLPAMF